MLLAFSCFFATAGAQVPEGEQWRYVSLYTSLWNRVDGLGFRIVDTNGRPADEAQLLATQLAEGDLLKDTVTKGLSVRLLEVSDSTINGFLINGSADTLWLGLNSSRIMSFTTEVTVAGKWMPFQESMPSMCGMGVGKGLLYPGYKCKLELERSTTGKVQLPFRLKVVAGGQTIVSNQVEVTCSGAQYRMISRKIREYTW